jgi:hypothetical protein
MSLHTAGVNSASNWPQFTGLQTRDAYESYTCHASAYYLLKKNARGLRAWAPNEIDVCQFVRYVYARMCKQHGRKRNIGISFAFTSQGFIIKLA